MKFIYQIILASLFWVVVPSTTLADVEPVIIHENIIVEESQEVHEGFQSPNEMVYVFVLIVLLSVIGLGIINTIE